ncbi:unnamed protein product, partial [Iphiclides podalirius]
MQAAEQSVQAKGDFVSAGTSESWRSSRDVLGRVRSGRWTSAAAGATWRRGDVGGAGGGVPRRANGAPPPAVPPAPLDTQLASRVPVRRDGRGLYAGTFGLCRRSAARRVPGTVSTPPTIRPPPAHRSPLPPARRRLLGERPAALLSTIHLECLKASIH